MSPSIYIFAGGGTGGHLYPALAVAENLTRIRSDARIVFTCSNRPIDRRILDSLSYAVVPQRVLPIPRGTRGWGRFLLAWVKSNRLGRRMVRDLRPVAVLGLGGFAAAPLVKAAAKRDIPTALLNPDSVPGRANRFLGKYVDVIFTQFKSTKIAFPPSLREKVRCVGCPVSERFFNASREEGIRYFGLRNDRKTLLILGGSQGAETINQAVELLAKDFEKLTDDWQVLHITGKRGREFFPRQEGIPGKKVPVPFFRVEYCERMDLGYAVADLVVGRCGAATVAELAATGTPAVLIPYPYHRDQHQRRNAATLAQSGAAVIIEDKITPRANADSLRRTLLPIMRDTTRLDRMRLAAENAPTHHPANQVATWLENAG